jgi:hypothetical protein
LTDLRDDREGGGGEFPKMVISSAAAASYNSPVAMTC